MVGVAMRALLIAAFYVLLVGQVQADEIALACGCALLCLGWSLLLTRVAHTRFHFSAIALSIAGQAIAEVPRGIARVVPALLRRRRGSIAREELGPGERDGGTASSRAAVLLAASLAPDRYALRWAKRGNAMEIHRLSIGQR